MDSDTIKEFNRRVLLKYGASWEDICKEECWQIAYSQKHYPYRG